MLLFRGLLVDTILAFGIGFLLNIVWENMHAVLYTNYKGGAITESVLLHATFADACMIAIAVFIWQALPHLKKRPALIMLPLLLIAIGIEYWALATLRWGYGPSMPLVPLLGVGLTPTVQLALTGYAALLLVRLA